MNKELRDLVDDSIRELKRWREENPNEEPNDRIWEIADTNTPVYHAEALELCVNNLGELATLDVENFDPSDVTPARIAQLAIYEYLEQIMWEWWNEQVAESVDDTYGSNPEGRIST